MDGDQEVNPHDEALHEAIWFLGPAIPQSLAEISSHDDNGLSPQSICMVVRV